MLKKLRGVKKIKACEFMGNETGNAKHTPL